MQERWTVRWFRKRALVYHLLVVIIAPSCMIAADWQIHRAASGNVLSWLYSVEWPVFSVLSIIGWWQLIHEDPARVESRKVERARRAATKGPFVPPPPDSPAGFTHPLQVASRPELAAGEDGRLPVAVLNDGDGDGGGGGGGDLVATAGDDATVHQLSEYNAYLARLAVGRTRKSWRNPHGVPTQR